MVKISAARVCEKRRERERKACRLHKYVAGAPCFTLSGISFSDYLFFWFVMFRVACFFSPCSSPFVNKLETRKPSLSVPLLSFLSLLRNTTVSVMRDEW